MKNYSNFLDLLSNYKSLPNGMIYSIEKKENDLKNAVFYVVDSIEGKSIEYVEGDLGDVPIEIYNDDFIVCELIETQIFKSIIDKKIQAKPKLDFNKNIKVFIDAVEFYMEFDTFQD